MNNLFANPNYLFSNNYFKKFFQILIRDFLNYIVVKKK